MPDPIRGEGRNLDSFDIASASISAEVSVTATSSATGNTCMTIGPFDAPGGNYDLDVFVPYLTLGTTNLDIELWDGATFLTTLSGHMTAAVGRPGTTLHARVNLARGVHTLTIKAFVDAGTGKFGANNGATGNAPNAIARLRPA